MSALSVPVASKTDAAVVSGIVREFAMRLGLSRIAAAEVALAASELATNCWRHGGGGRVELRCSAEALELRVIDTGPGIPLPAHAQQDGVSQGARVAAGPRPSLGVGLGSVHRLMDEVQILSYESVGTTVIARKLLRGSAA